MNRNDNMGLFFRNNEKLDPFSGMKKKKGVTLHSVEPLSIDLLRSVMDSIAPTKLTKAKRDLGDSHVDSLLEAYEEYKKTISSGLNDSQVEN
jgi:hypothetical protein